MAELNIAYNEFKGDIDASAILISVSRTGINNSFEIIGAIDAEPDFDIEEEVSDEDEVQGGYHLGNKTKVTVRGRQIIPTTNKGVANYNRIQDGLWYVQIEFLKAGDVVGGIKIRKTIITPEPVHIKTKGVMKRGALVELTFKVESDDIGWFSDSSLLPPLWFAVANDDYDWEETNIIAGINGSATSPAGVQFKLNSVPGATSYTLQFSSVSDFSSILSSPPETNFSHVPNQSIQSVTLSSGFEDDKYMFFRVRANNAIGDGPYSQVRSLRTLDSVARAGIIAAHNNSFDSNERINATNSYFNNSRAARRWQVRRGIISETVRRLRVLQIGSTKVIWEKLRMLVVAATFYIRSVARTRTLDNGFGASFADRVARLFDWVRPNLIETDLPEVWEVKRQFWYLPNYFFTPAVLNADFGLRQNGVRVQETPTIENSPFDGTIINTRYNHSLDNTITPDKHTIITIAAIPNDTKRASQYHGKFTGNNVNTAGQFSPNGGVSHRNDLGTVVMDQALQLDGQALVSVNTFVATRRDSATTAKAFYSANIVGTLNERAYSFIAVSGEQKMNDNFWFGGYARDSTPQGIADNILQVAAEGEDFTDLEINYFRSVMNYYLNAIQT